MKAWHFSENAYPYLPPADEYESIRVSLPNRIYDPEKGAALYDRFLDEWLIAEDEGMEIMLNEHHQTATCVDPAAPLVLAALARLSKKARLLILGNPISNRRQPVRVAEEMAMVDVLSRGRLEAGFVRGVPYEVLPANSNPVRMNERQWEALDLIVKAWTSHDGPFSHEGRFFHYRAVNIWPRPYQQPHPPIWISTTSPSGAARVGAHGYIQATFLTGFDGTRAHVAELVVAKAWVPVVTPTVWTPARTPASNPIVVSSTNTASCGFTARRSSVRLTTSGAGLGWETSFMPSMRSK